MLLVAVVAIAIIIRLFLRTVKGKKKIGEAIGDSYYINTAVGWAGWWLKEKANGRETQGRYPDFYTDEWKRMKNEK